MPIKRPPLINNEIYHIIIRGVGDSSIFNNDEDRFRAILSLYEFNTTKSVEISIQRRKRKSKRNIGELFSDTRDLLVEILAFCFMPNHIHLLLRQVRDNGITDFMRKFGAGYAMYFNKKYNRKGHLFQGRFKAVHIKTEDQLRTVFVYIHINPLSLIEPNWKEKGIHEPIKAIEFLENYRWSSYLDYIDKKNFSSLTKRNLFQSIIGKAKEIKEFTYSWIYYKNTINIDDSNDLE